jgi:hypothetical protein
MKPRSAKNHMNPAQRVVTSLPLAELWTAAGPMRAVRLENIGADQVRDLVRGGVRTFVVANVGAPLEWMSDFTALQFWKRSRTSIASPNQRWFLDNYPDRQLLAASRWETPSGDPIIVFELHH